MAEDFLDESFDPTDPDELLNDLDDRIDAAWLERDYASVAHLAAVCAHVVGVVNEQNGRDTQAVFDTAASIRDLTGESVDLAELASEMRQTNPLPVGWFLPAGPSTAERLDLVESALGDLRDLQADPRRSLEDVLSELDWDDPQDD